MRLHLKLTKNKTIVAFNYQKDLTRCIHQWLGVNNEQHGNISLYSFSWIQNVMPIQEGINLRHDANMFLSIYETDTAKEIIKGILHRPEMFCGISVSEIIMQETPQFSTKETFVTASPILIKRRLENGSEKHFTYMDDEADKYMTETLKTKLKKAGIEDEGVSVSFDKTEQSCKTKVIGYGSIKNRVNICPVNIEGTSRQVAFAWHVGLGNSTGIGFGALK